MSRRSGSDYARLDEDDVRVRPGRGTRPRTRTRPAHSAAVQAFVTTVDRGRYGCVISGAPDALDADGVSGAGGGAGADDADGAADRTVVAMKARELGRGSVVVGDRVALAGDISGEAGTLARIVRVEPRTSALRRSADDTDPVERIIVANADQMVIVCALASPEPRLRFVDRCLVAAYDAGLEPLLVLTKADLAPPRKVRALYTPVGVRMLTTRKPLPAQTLSRLRGLLAGRLSVLIGQSGVGKSTLVNVLMPDAVRAVGSVNPVTGRGRHTSSSAVAFPLPPWRPGRGRAGTSSVAGTDRGLNGEAGWLIDTPGLRGFGLGHVPPERLVAAFGDLVEGTAKCLPGCPHVIIAPDGTIGAPEGCALDEWAREHHALTRLDSLRRLLAGREGGLAD
jgi:ribosome biogenesis GTPase / thiamine phosphate phosphatase